VTIDWSGVRGTTLRLYAVGTTDYTVFQESTSPVEEQDLSPNGNNEAKYMVPVSGTMPLEFAVCEESSSEPPGLYNFTVTAQHGLAVSLAARTNVLSNSVVNGTANLASGTPAPDGMVFTLTATWGDGSATYSAPSVGGGLSFQLALPESAEGQTVTLIVNRAADAEYQEAKSAELQVKVAKARVEPPPPPPTPQHSHRKPLKCRKHFKKRRVQGKARCVRVRHHHPRYRHHRR